MTQRVRSLIDDYTAAVSEGDFERLADLVHPDATFGGTVVSEATGVEAFVQGFRNLRPITIRTEVRSAIVDDDRAAVMYDLITDTPVGPVLCAEFLTTDGKQIRSSTLLFDWRRWPEVINELRDRTDTTTR